MEFLDAIIETVVKELDALDRNPSASPPAPAPAAAMRAISVPAAPEKPLAPAHVKQSGIPRPVDADGLQALMESTTARIGVGRAGLRPPTGQLLAFQADLAVTKDALTRVVDPGLLEELGLFTVRTRVEGGTEEYLRRPDLGRRLSEAAMATIAARCVKNPDVQLCVGDGLSSQAIEANLRSIFPVIKSGCATAGLSFGVPFFVERCRVGVMNDIGDVLAPRVLILLIGERPGLGRADAMSAYLGYQPRSGLSDADRDVVCNIYDGGGVNPLEAGAYVLRLAQRMIQAGASGVKLKLMEEHA